MINHRYQYNSLTSKPDVTFYISALSAIIILLAGTKSYAQGDSSESSIFYNDSIHYTIVFVSPTSGTIKSDPTSKRYVKVHLSREYRKSLLKQTGNFWISRLQNDSTDWATNLVLYCLYDKDATPLAYIFNNRKKWLKIKKDEIEYWKRYFSDANSH